MCKLVVLPRNKITNLIEIIILAERKSKQTQGVIPVCVQIYWNICIDSMMGISVCFMAPKTFIQIVAAVSLMQLR